MFDALSIAAVADELSSSLVRGRIQRVQHVDKLTVAVEVYARGQRGWLTLSADNQDARITLDSERPPSDVDLISPLLLLLRKYVRGARVLAVHQPRFERIIRFTVAMATYEDDDDGDGDVDLQIHDLVLEIMGRHSNLILVDESGRIRDSVKRVTPAMSRVRRVLPGNAYTPPPPQEKLNPLQAGPTEVIAAAEGNSQRLDRWLVATFLGLSPVMATEVLYRSGLSRQDKPETVTVARCEAILRHLRELYSSLDTGEWAPRVYLLDGGATFSAVPLRHLEDREDVETQCPPSIMEAINLARGYGATGDAADDRHAPRRDRLVAEIEEARRRLLRRQQALERQRDQGSSPDELRTSGEMIYAYLWMIEPGMTELVTPEGLAIELDPDLSPNDNAQEYFERYRKARSAADEIPKLLDETLGRLAYLDQLKVTADQAETYDEIESVRQEWQEFAGSISGVGSASRPGGSKPSSSARRPRRYDLDSGAIVWIGKTGRQNDAVTFDIGSQDDLWLHARDMPGAHVILRPAPGSEATEADIEQAAALAAYYSSGRNSAYVPIDVTERRHVRKIRGSGPGMVTYRNEYTIDVEPRSEKALELAPAGAR